MILARHAEAVFWAGRHLERAEHTTRMLDVATRASMHFPNSPVQPEWQRLLQVVGANQSFADTGRPSTGPAVAQFLIVSRDNPGSVAQTVNQLRENVRTVRDRMPVELWEESNLLRATVDEVGDILPAAPFELYSTIRRRCHALSGIVSEVMPRGDAYAFMVLGRAIERATITVRTIRFLLLADDHNLDEGSILRTVASLQAYRRRARPGGDSYTLGAFLLLADDVPRTVLSCLRWADHRIQRLMRAAPTGLAPAAMVSGRLRSRLEFSNAEDELRHDGVALLGHVESELLDLTTAIADYAFDPARIPAMHSQFVRPGQPSWGGDQQGDGGL